MCYILVRLALVDTEGNKLGVHVKQYHSLDGVRPFVANM
jgi:hypothetical protein